MAENSPSDKRILELISSALSTVALIAALLYLAGWSFAYQFFTLFHVGLLELALPREYLFVYGGWVMQDRFPILLLALLAPYVILYLGLQFNQRWNPDAPASNRRALLFLGLTPFVILWAFLVTYWLGADVALQRFEEHRQARFASLFSTEIILKASVQNTYADQLARGCYKRVIQNDEHIYLLYALDTTVDAVALLVLPVEDIQYMRILPYSQYCD